MLLGKRRKMQTPRKVFAPFLLEYVLIIVSGLAIADALNQCMSDLQHVWVSTGFPVLVLATTAASEQVPMAVSSLFKHQILMEVRLRKTLSFSTRRTDEVQKTPEDGERLDILETLLDDTAVNPDVSIKDLARDTAAFVSRDLFDLTRRAKNSTVAQILHERSNIDPVAFSLFANNIIIVLRNSLDLRSLQLKAKDIDKALAKARENHAESIGAPQIPQVSWDDVGGIAEAKADILDTIQLPLEHPELFASGMKKRSGWSRDRKLTALCLTDERGRYPLVRSSGYRQDSASKSSRNLMCS